MSPQSQQHDTLRLEQLIDLAAVLSQQNYFKEIVRLVAEKASHLLNAEVAIIRMVNPRTRQTVKTIYREGFEDNHNRCNDMVRRQVSGWLLKYKRPLLSADIKKDTRFKSVSWDDAQVKSVLGVPLQIEGIRIGSLILLNKGKKGKFDESDLSFLTNIALIAAPYLRNVQKIQRYFETPLPEAALLAKYEPLGLFGKSKQFLELLQAVEAAARCDVRVLLEGQSGTGKELLARAIHQFSARKQHPFVAIDCGAIPENLLESELFGYVKGAFTGAIHDRTGLIAEAHGGTLFMDEITNLPYDMQAKLLRVLQEGEVRVLGSNKPRQVDVRFISASSSSLRTLVDQRKFREDLFYRLHVYPIHVPTLNKRRQDIPLLAHYFLNKFARQQQKHAETFHGAILDFMQQRKWSGNIRELENFVERLVTLASTEMTVLDLKILPREFQKEFKKLTPEQESPLRKSLQESLAESEEQLIRQALLENDWKQRKTARVLQISEGALRYKMDKLGIEKPVTDDVER